MKKVIEILKSELLKLESKRAGYLKNINEHEETILSLKDSIKSHEKAITNLVTMSEKSFDEIVEMRESIEKLR